MFSYNDVNNDVIKYVKRDVIFSAKKMVDFDRCLTYNNMIYE